MTLKRIIHNGATGEITEVDLTAEEIKAREDAAPAIALNTLRETRNFLLAETDVYALSDRTLSDEMKAYRQALRDLPANTSDPTKPTWPTKPS